MMLCRVGENNVDEIGFTCNTWTTVAFGNASIALASAEIRYDGHLWPEN